jgi:hypothetical protein
MAVSKRARFSLEWIIISKRTVYLLVASIIGIAAAIWGGIWLYQNRQVIDAGPVNRQSARFIQIEGKVKVKRANSTEFSTATEDTQLEAGDTIQTQADSVARVQFVDGSSYTIKPETTLVIKDNSLNDNQTTRVHVGVEVGTINLATGDQAPGSVNVVQTNAARANVGSNTEASVAAGEKTEIRVTRGTANILTRSNERLQASANERVEIENNGHLASRTMMLPVPVLRTPDNQKLVRLVQGQPNAVTFSWGAVAQARSYRLEIATSAYFGGTIIATRDHLASPSTVFDSLPPGSYYWHVRASDEKGEVSQYSEPFKFTIITTRPSHVINITGVKHTALGGNSYVIEGHAEPGTRVKVGGVTARVEPNGDFKAFVILSGGSREILIEAEDQDGNTGQKRLRL